MPRKVCCSLLFLTLYLSAIAAGQDVRNRMNEFVDSVKDAVKEAESANNKREVVDLGQSLHLLESKFASLRSALSQELGAKSSKLVSHSGASKELMDQSTDLVRGVVSQREELRRLSSDVKEVDSAVRALRAGLDNFEKDVAELGKVMSDLHVSHNELTATHDETKERMREVIADRNDKHMRGGGHGFLVFALLVEIVIFVAFLYFKRPGGALAHKAYGKFG